MRELVELIDIPVAVDVGVARAREAARGNRLEERVLVVDLDVVRPIAVDVNAGRLDRGSINPLLIFTVWA